METIFRFEIQRAVGSFRYFYQKLYKSEKNIGNTLVLKSNSVIIRNTFTDNFASGLLPKHSSGKEMKWYSFNITLQ